MKHIFFNENKLILSLPLAKHTSGGGGVDGGGGFGGGEEGGPSSSNIISCLFIFFIQNHSNGNTSDFLNAASIYTDSVLKVRMEGCQFRNLMNINIFFPADKLY